MKKILLILLIPIFLFSCKSGKAPSGNLIIDLNPNIQTISKDYYKYPIKNAFHSDYFLYSPIEPSETNKNQPRILIPNNIDNGNYYNYFYEFIKNKMNGRYTSYLMEGNMIKYYNYIRYYQDGEKKMDLQDINNYFKQAKISYKLKKDKTTGYIFMLEKNNEKDSAVCIVFLDNDKIETEIYYKMEDTINSLSRQSMRPYIGESLEN